jgi:hypothetical protein
MMIMILLPTTSLPVLQLAWSLSPWFGLPIGSNKIASLKPLEVWPLRSIQFESEDDIHWHGPSTSVQHCEYHSFVLRTFLHLDDKL